MASFLTLVSRYLGKKKKFVEKQKVTAEKDKKKKAKQFAADYPSHDKQLKSWEKTYGEKKQKADAKFEGERKKRVMKARAMGPALRKKKYRSASVYMVKDPFTKPPTKPRGAGKTTYLTKKAKKKNDFITKMNAPIKEELLKESTRMAMPPIRGISQSLIDAVKQAQTNQPASIDKPLDMSLKGVDNKQSIKESHPSDAHFIKQQIDGHRKAAAEAKKRGDHHRAMAHEQQARDYEQHGMSGSRFETSSGLKYEEVNMEDTVTEGAKKIKLTPGMKPKDFKAAKTAMKQKVVAKAKKAAAKKKAAPSMPKVSSAPEAKPEEEDDKMLSRLLKGKLKHGDHPHLAKAIVSKIRTTHVKDRAEMQKKIYHAKSGELDSLLK